MATQEESEGDPEAVIPCEVCQASIPLSQYVQHAEAHATLVIPDEYKPFTQKQGNENWLNNEGATGYLKPELNIKQRLQDKEHKKMTTYGYAHENCDQIVPDSIVQIIIVYHDTFYIDVLETGCIFRTLEQATKNPQNTGQTNKIQVVFSNNEPIRIKSTPFRHSVEWRDIEFVCDGCLTPIFMEILETNKSVVENKSCFSIVGKNYIFDCFAENKLAVNIFVEALWFFLKQNRSESNKLAEMYLKDNLYGHRIPKFNKRQKRLMSLQQDLFVMTITGVLRELEEEKIWCIDAQIREIFNAQSMYAMALSEDVPWRQWRGWIRDKIVTYLRNNNKVDSNAKNRCDLRKYDENIHHYPTPMPTVEFDTELNLPTMEIDPNIHPNRTPNENLKTGNDDEECLVM